MSQKRQKRKPSTALRGKAAAGEQRVTSGFSVFYLLHSTALIMMMVTMMIVIIMIVIMKIIIMMTVIMIILIIKIIAPTEALVASPALRGGDV